MAWDEVLERRCKWEYGCNGWRGMGIMALMPQRKDILVMA